MWYTLVALVAGVLLGLVARGSFRHMGEHAFRAWLVLPLGVVLQALPELLDLGETGGFAFLLASYLALALFALVNLRLVGMPIVLVGLLMNLAPIAANRGMPVRADAISAARVAEPEEIPALDFDAKHHLETADDQWMLLSDIIPVRPLREVLSYGDLVMSFGIANVIFRLMKPRPNRRRRDDSASEEQDADEGPLVDLTAADAEPTRALSIKV
jgi:hypothetical protein